MINDSISISLKETSGNNINYIYTTNKSIALGYPCGESDKCTPYKISLRRGTYFFECWGSAARIWSQNNKSSTPGYGAYTSGTLFVPSLTQFYIYIGHSGFFNAVKTNENIGTGVFPGGATDIRLKDSNNWWDTESLISRIMVAAGGGSSEWVYSIGGDGGDIEGGESTSAKFAERNSTFEDKCPGANQTNGSICPNYTAEYVNNTIFSAVPGTFGSAVLPTPYNGSDYGGFGGGGYYGGTSYPYAFAGSGGSSFISGHPQCNSVQENSKEIVHTDNPYHYSGFIFHNTTMIPGHQEMPLPNGNTNGIYSGTGAFRITLLFINPITTHESIFLHHIIIAPMLTLSHFIKN